MAIQLISVGTTADDGKGDTLRVAMTKINENTTELYELLGQDTAGAKGIDISGSTIATTETNADITLSTNGTGAIVLDALSVSGTTLSAADSSMITVAENLHVTGNLTTGGTLDVTGDFTFTGNEMTSSSNAHMEITPGGTGNVNLNADTVRIGDADANATLTTQGTGDLTISTNSGTNSGTITIADGANGDITIENNGTGDILLKAGGQVGLGDVSSPDTSLHIKQANAILTLQRTSDTGTPGIDFQQAGGNVRAQIYMDGTNGISKELIFKVQDGTLDERFRVTKSGASVTGTFNIMSDNDSTLSDATISMTQNEITTLRSNDNLVLSANGTGTVQTTSNVHLLSGTPIIQIQRTDNANVPGISFLGDGGTEGGSIKFDGTSGTTNEIILSSFHSSAVTERLRVQTTGAKVTGILKIGDGSSTDNYAGFGDADDLKIFHNGSHSIVRETGTGSLYLQSDNNVILGKDTGGEIFVKGVADGTVELYHDNSKKLETTSGGVLVTGTLDIDSGITITDNLITASRSNDNLQLDATGSGAIEMIPAVIMMANLPTSDPSNAGQLWNDSGDLKVSAG